MTFGSIGLAIETSVARTVGIFFSFLLWFVRCNFFIFLPTYEITGRCLSCKTIMCILGVVNWPKPLQCF